MVMTLSSIAYFSIDYNFTKSMKLGVLSGVLLGLGLSLVAALFLLFTRKESEICTRDLSIYQE